MSAAAHRRIGIGVCALLIGWTGATRAEPAAPWSETLRVATYNVQFVTPWRFGEISPKHWPNTAARARAIGEELACFDIVGLSETINDQRRAEILAAMEDAGSACGRPSRLADGRSFEVLAGPAGATPSLAKVKDFLVGDAALVWLGNEVMIASRLPILASASMTYSSARGSDALAAKGVLHARLGRSREAPRDATLDVFVTHLQANHADVRKAQLAELAAFVRERADPGLPALLLGDLNIDGSDVARRNPDAEYHDLMQTVAALGFRDPGQAVGGTDSWQRRRIDYILTRSPQLAVSDMQTRQFNDLSVRALSDHAALTATLTWRPTPSAHALLP